MKRALALVKEDGEGDNVTIARALPQRQHSQSVLNSDTHMHSGLGLESPLVGIR